MRPEFFKLEVIMALNSVRNKLEINFFHEISRHLKSTRKKALLQLIKIFLKITFQRLDKRFCSKSLCRKHVILCALDKFEGWNFFRWPNREIIILWFLIELCRFKSFSNAYLTLGILKFQTWIEGSIALLITKF